MPDRWSLIGINREWRGGASTLAPLVQIQSRRFSAVYYWEGSNLRVPKAFLADTSTATVEEGFMSQADVFYKRTRPMRPLSIGAGTVVVHEGRVLLVRSIYGVTRGRYLLPAGNVNAGELPDTAAARETFEETNLRVEIEGLLGVRIWVRDDGEHNYFFMFHAKLR